MSNRPCPKCRELGRDATGDHLFLLEDGITWYCDKSCHPPYLERDETALLPKEEKITDNKMSQSDINHWIKEIMKYPIMGNPDRCITEATHSVFRVRTALSESDRTPTATFYPELTGGKFNGYKRRKFPKKFMTLLRNAHLGDSMPSPDFFGQDRCPRSGNRVLLCAGEEDAMAAYQMLKSKYPDTEPCVLGLPRGEGGSGDTIADRLELLSNFSEIIIATDQDEAGKKALAKIVPIIGEGCKYLSISENDINDMLIKGKEKEFYNAFFNAKEYKPANMIDVSDILEESIKRVDWGLTYPWEGLTQLTYGLKDVGEIIGLGASPGAGKSTLLQMMQRHLVFTHGQQIVVFDIEEGPEMGLKKLVGSTMNQPIHKPDCEYDIDEARAIGNRFKGLVHFYGGDSEDWTEVETAIRYYASKGIRFFFIDPLSALVEHLTASEANTELGKIMRSMRKFRKNQGLTFFHANHLNNPNTGKEHGEGGVVRGGQFSGSRAQWKYSTLLLGAERNQYADNEHDKNRMILRVLKDRLGGNTGFIELAYDPNQGILIEDSFHEVI